MHLLSILQNFSENYGEVFTYINNNSSFSFYGFLSLIKSLPKPSSSFLPIGFSDNKTYYLLVPFSSSHPFPINSTLKSSTNNFFINDTEIVYFQSSPIYVWLTLSKKV
ncbi:MAG: hypothetical protein KFW09_01840 [Oscillospiraceae bacterium]|nr:hypothetical protein [Oscillospiraceae bacterium]